MGRVLWACVAVILLGDRVISREPERRGNVSIQIINFNLERTLVKWNVSEYLAEKNLTFLYGLDNASPSQECPHYTIYQGYTSGCVFKAENKGLTFLLKREDKVLERRVVRLRHYLKPNSPTNVSFTWREDSVIITCSDLPYHGLTYEIQHKSIFDQKWQSNTNEICNVTIGSLDFEKCYFFRARVVAKMAMYGSRTYPSDWSPVTHWKRSKLKDSCTEAVEKTSPKYIYIITSLVIFLMVLLLLLFLSKAQRVKKLFMPVVPDPKYSFPGLFDCHKGNFQEWIQDTENVTSSIKVEHLEQECVVEEGLIEELAKKEAKDKDGKAFQEHLQSNEDNLSSNQVSCVPPQGNDSVCLGDLKFVMNDSMYVVL
ncbi:cytokine receptor-like factor 2 [Dromiciops gliroides]|uniref:cytokine receptor-like factor 2 n=1 Tax=Dromiciops gliroides TaxID=33562 RepID=UPI001CC57885|nr:cytokine receptor-like factor 2 [Dromiciops gliroides]